MTTPSPHYLVILTTNSLLFVVCFCVLSQGNDEEAVLDQGKTSSTLYTNFEKEELESESHSHTQTHTHTHTQ